MKIIRQTSDELVIGQGRTVGMVTAVCLIAIGVGVWFIHTSIVTFISIVFILLGIIGILLTPALSIDLDKKSGTIVSSAKSIVGLGTSKSYDLAVVEKIEIKREWQKMNFGTKNIGWRYKLNVHPAFVLKGGGEIPIGPDTASSRLINTGTRVRIPLAGFAPGSFGAGPYFAKFLPGEEDITQTLKPVATFLGVPINETDPGPNKWITEEKA